MTVQNKITIFVFVFVHKKHSFYLHRIWNGSLKCTVLAECTFIGTTVKLSQLSKQTADWWSCCDGWYCRGSSRGRKDFLSLLSWCFNKLVHLVTVEKKIYIYVHMPSVFSVAEASPGVQFVMASLGNVVNGNKKRQKCITISSEDARSKPTVILLCSTWTLFECFFYFWGTSTKKLNYTVCHCCTVSVETWILCLVS